MNYLRILGDRRNICIHLQAFDFWFLWHLSESLLRQTSEISVYVLNILKIFCLCFCNLRGGKGGGGERDPSIERNQSRGLSVFWKGTHSSLVYIFLWFKLPYGGHNIIDKSEFRHKCTILIGRPHHLWQNYDAS